MLNEVCAFIRQHSLLKKGDRVVCAVSGGGDSVALLYAMKLLADKLEITVTAAHFNHGLRGAESNSDEAFVRALCDRLDIPLQVGSGKVVVGKKGLEAAARCARYDFLQSLPGKIATAHTADDNAETVLMHLVRGTGLKGLGGIMPVNGKVIRPMLRVTRQQVEAFLQENNLRYVTDSSNETDQFLRNRIRHHVMPLLRQENPRIGENLSDMALRLREDEAFLQEFAHNNRTTDVLQLRQMPAPIRQRVLSDFLEECGIPEPEAAHVELAESLVFSSKPSAKAAFPGGVTLSRSYDRLTMLAGESVIAEKRLQCPGMTEIPEMGICVICKPADELVNTPDRFTVKTTGEILVRSRCAGDKIRRPGGTKSLKALFIDRKIPRHQRDLVPVLTDETGILGVFGFGADVGRLADQLPALEICFQKIEK